MANTLIVKKYTIFKVDSVRISYVFFNKAYIVDKLEATICNFLLFVIYLKLGMWKEKEMTR